MRKKKRSKNTTFLLRIKRKGKEYIFYEGFRGAFRPLAKKHIRDLKATGHDIITIRKGNAIILYSRRTACPQ